MKRRLLLSAGAAASALVLTGCAGPQISDFAGQKPALDLRQYFNGTLDAYGVFTDRSGAVVKRFTVVMRCSWTGEDGVLDEDFTYSDGTTQKRIWRLKHLGNGRYSGTADDVVGSALGETQGNSFRWGYTLALPVGGTSDAGPPQVASAPSGGSAAREAASVGATIVNVEFDDWMYLMDQRVMLNKATMSKFGIRLGEVTLSFVKR
ncbi:MAG: DUF3833 domain-containing protein [Hydrogenophaga sp.]|uniref:DUF3833 domain-containing protein n=1 Tax=Hydrogenophaga sp. TaxID=1904254 RepID=UPI0025BACEC5|nr:DUF3833 domain-containing protein [Hydrogenophaga sp.]MBT9552579.1 DUF3833 domain-containing protein [Hydrogenophaga sp.]